MNGFIRMAILALMLIPSAVLADAGYGGMSSFAPERSPEKIAVDAYNYGSELRDDAIEYEQEAEAETDPKKKEKLLSKAQKSYTKAAEKFRKAVDNNPQLYQAWSALGHALRKTGDYDASLQAYEQALTLNPQYYEAVEYRAEAHMHLGQYEKVKSAYAVLLQGKPEYASKLLTQINKWLPTQDLKSSVELQAFAAWAGQQK
jgi:tetratricopeptide (TPR) repeat protein